MAELAAQLESPGIRVFGDTVQPGTTEVATRNWISESIAELGQKIRPLGVEVWIESHGDFAAASKTVEVLDGAGVSSLGVVWDPANAYAECDEEPETGIRVLGTRVRHVHVKDAQRPQRPSGDPKQLWDPVLIGEGDFPAARLLSILSSCGYQRYVSFEWEKKWHPQIPEAEVALPHFMNWVRQILAVGLEGRK